MPNERLQALQHFYSIMSRLDAKLGGPQTLNGPVGAGQAIWPRRGVYFFYEQGEQRSDSGVGLRVVRVGTHALRAGAKTKLWTRLAQHRGQIGSGGGNHRSSIFRLLVGTIERDGYNCDTWGSGGVAPREARDAEHYLECAVNKVVRSMPFLWLAVDDEPGPQSVRGYIERNSIALLSNYGRRAIDLPSDTWLGRCCNRERVRNSGLWNWNHVDETFDPAFLVCLERLVQEMEPAR
jgi:hypothetical protein